MGRAQPVDTVGGAEFDATAELESISETIHAGIKREAKRRPEDPSSGPYFAYHFSNAFAAAGTMGELEGVQHYDTDVGYAQIYRGKELLPEFADQPAPISANSHLSNRSADVFAHAQIWEEWDPELGYFRPSWDEDTWDPYVDGTLLIARTKPPETGHTIAVAVVAHGANGVILKSFEKSTHDGGVESQSGPETEDESGSEDAESDGGGSDGETEADSSTREKAQDAVQEAAGGNETEEVASVGLASVDLSLEPDPFEVVDNGDGTTTVQPDPTVPRKLPLFHDWLDPVDVTTPPPTGSEGTLIEDPDGPFLLFDPTPEPAESDAPEPTPAEGAIDDLYEDIFRNAPYNQSDLQSSADFESAGDGPASLTINGAAIQFDELTMDVVPGYDRTDYLKAYLTDGRGVRLVAPDGAQVGWEPVELFRTAVLPGESLTDALDGAGLHSAVHDRAEALASRRADTATLLLGTAGTLERSVSTAAASPGTPVARALDSIAVGEALTVSGQVNSHHQDQTVSTASAAITDSQMAYLLDSFDQHREQVPGALAWVLGDERARVRILVDDELEDVWWVETRDGRVARYAHGDGVRPTVQVFADRGALHGVLAAEDPAAAAIEAYDTGAIRVTGVGIIGRLKFGFARVVYALLAGFGMV